MGVSHFISGFLQIMLHIVFETFIVHENLLSEVHLH